MNLIALPPTKVITKQHRLQAASREQIGRFKTYLIKLLGHINEQESEENVKDHLMDFLKEVYYKDSHVVAPKGKTDFVIHLGKEATTQAGVLFEVKRPVNKSEMVSRSNLNTKAFHELLLYYFQERQRSKNSDLRHCVITNVYEWYVFDAALIDRLFYRNSELIREYKNWAEGRKVSKNSDLFYNEIVKPFLAELTEDIPFTYFDLRDYEKIVADDDKVNDKALIALYKILSPTHLLKLPTATDSNKLNPRFYAELLHLIGLEEIKEGGKKVIERKEATKRDEGSLLENTLIELETSGKLYRLHDRSQYGATFHEQLFSVGLELCITWINRVLFLKLLESQLVKYHTGNREYAFLNTDMIPGFDELNKLFFRVLAHKPSTRQPSIQAKFGNVPYLNSSLFEMTELEKDTIGINQLDNGLKLPIYKSSVLAGNEVVGQAKDLPTLAYLFAFLDAYDFASESGEMIQEKNRTLINASVLGLIFEKINGYKDGSFYTPGFITEYMCRETIRKAVVQKFNEAYGWNCKDFADLENQDYSRVEANALINEVRICDPAVGSGHFLVSALNELISIKSALGVLLDHNGKRIKDYSVSILNDELIIQDEDETPFSYVLGATGKPTPERQRVQKTLFHEKQMLIENCLFGVDINPNSVKICRLRLWIELLKNAYYTEESGFTELETLPNIDINIQKGNSLLSKFSLTEDLSEVFRKQKFSLQAYKNAVSAYKEAKSKEAKEELSQFIREIKKQFRESVLNRDPRRKKIARLRGQRLLLDNNIDVFGNTIKDPKLVAIEQDRLGKFIEQIEGEIADIESDARYKGSFEWRFEFPEVLDEKGDFVGFDAVIGNPPYGVNLNASFGQIFSSAYETFSFRGESYVLFVEKAVALLKKHGSFGFIIPDTLLNLGFTQAVRSFVLKNTQLQEVILLPTAVFTDATVDTILLFFQKTEPEKTFVPAQVSVKTYAKKSQIDSLINPERLFYTTAENWHLSKSFNVKSNYQELAIVNRVDSTFPVLGTFAEMYSGIKAYEVGKGTPPQTAFVRDTKPYTSTEKHTADWSPFFDGKHIGRYQLLWRENNWVQYGGWLAAPRLPENFENEKILIRKITGRTLIATYIPYTSYCNTLLFVLKLLPAKSTITYKSLLGVLNSTFIGWYFKKKFQISDEDTFPQIMIRDILQFAVPNVSNSLTEAIETLVDKILAIKTTDPSTDTSALEAEIDRLVYALYGLTEVEIAVIEN